MVDGPGKGVLRSGLYSTIFIQQLQGESCYRGNNLRGYNVIVSASRLQTCGVLQLVYWVSAN